MAEGDVIVDGESNYNGNTSIEENVEEAEPNFDDPPGFIDDISDEGLFEQLCKVILIFFLCNFFDRASR